ncbi:hypothetical protein ASU31_18875 [Pedobacter ginsenosidimutans]|uniref:Uncharacterized protein n=1 Tax=Pedobacter ginsenosidimutans TaxID=687842 RepID=A0A0T5VKW8_9SPHI|nr:hypothetical protein ASU31_18875 [Pedobacter ginsenosidimutans]
MQTAAEFFGKANQHFLIDQKPFRFIWQNIPAVTDEPDRTFYTNVRGQSSKKIATWLYAAPHGIEHGFKMGKILCKMQYCAGNHQVEGFIFVRNVFYRGNCKMLFGFSDTLSRSQFPYGCYRRWVQIYTVHIKPLAHKVADVPTLATTRIQDCIAVRISAF